VRVTLWRRAASDRFTARDRSARCRQTTIDGLCHLLGFRLARRIKNLKERNLYATLKPATYPLLDPLIGGTVETAAIIDQWPALMPLKASIQTGMVAPSVILRKLAAAGPGNAL
jgi:TnpA family transposase